MLAERLLMLRTLLVVLTLGLFIYHKRHMVDIIEISEGSKDFENDLVKINVPEVYNLEDSLSFNRDNQTNYPSSPQPTSRYEQEHIEVITSDPVSPEVSIPFCHDLSSVGGGTLPFNELKLPEDSTRKHNEKLLDKILGTTSSPDSTASEMKCDDGAISLKKLATNCATNQSIPSMKNTNAVHYNSAVHEIGVLPLGESKDVLTEYPLSSPVVNLIRSDKVSENELPMPYDEKNDEKHQLQQSSPAKESTASIKKRTGGQKAEHKLQKVYKPTKQRVCSSSHRPDTVELNLSKFLRDKSEEEPQSSQKKSQMPSKDENRPSHLKFNRKDLENIKLQQYILRSKCYTQQESDALVHYWLREDKEKFRQANQIYRSSENARSSIIVEMSCKLLETFKESKDDIERLISPATLQIGYDTKLPKIRFLRRFTSVYDLNHDIYYPTDLKIMEENINILFYDAQTFFELYRNDRRTLFDIIQLFSKNDKYLIIILSDLNKLKRSIDSLEDHRYKARVQEQLTGSQQAFSHSKRINAIKNLDMKTFDLEQRLRHIDRLWNVKLHTVNSIMEFISTLPNLVSIVGRQRMDPAIRFMKYSHLHVKSSKGRTDTLRQTLRHINKMPELKCDSVTNAYPNFQSLFVDFEKGQLKSGLDGKHLMTEAMESRLYKLFTCRNPDETIQ